MYLFSFRVPTTEMGWKEIDRDLNDKWNFLGCCGTIDGKHITIHAPANYGSTFIITRKVTA